MRGIDNEAADDAGRAKTHETPVMIGSAMAARFPAIHPFAGVDVFVRDENGRSGLEQIFLRREKFVGGGEHRAAEALGGEVHQIREVTHVV